MLKSLFPRFFVAIILNLALSAVLTSQTVTFTVAGSNPRCIEEYPNGAPYFGQASVANIPGAFIVSVDFQIQRWLGNTWGFVGGPFTVTPFSWGTTTVSYSNNTPGATPLTITPISFIRMRAIIRYRIGDISGETRTAIVYSPGLWYNHFSKPRFDYQIGCREANPDIPAAVYTCEGLKIVLSNTLSGTGFRWRIEAYNSTASGGQGTPFGDYHTCDWQTGVPPLEISLNDPYGNGSCSAPWNTLNGEYILVRLMVENDCGLTVRDALIQVFPQPSGAQVDFFFRGSTQADGYAPIGPNDRSPTGEQNPQTGQASQTDGVLSWGGTFAQPTWVGASQTVLDCSAANFYCGLQSWTVKIEWSIPGGGWDFAGEYTETNPDNSQINIQSVVMSINGAPATDGYFSQNFNSSPTGVLGKIFRVTLEGNGVCGQKPSKTGFFRIIPTQPWHFSDTDTEEHVKDRSREGYVDNYLKVYPNPANTIVNLDVDSNEEADVLVRVLDIHGRLVNIENLGKMKILPGVNRIIFSVDLLPPGKYILQITSPKGVSSVSFVRI